MTEKSVAPRLQFHLTSSAATDLGNVRAVNEDSFLASQPLYVVADGMGGHNAGEIASAIVIDEFAHLAGRSHIELDSVADVLVNAYERIASIEDSGSRSAGTTVAMVALTIHEDAPHWVVMNLGDSRVYAIRQGEFSQVSVDHSVVQELVDRGEITEAQARVHPYRNMITRALGAGPDARPDFWLLEVAAGDRFLLCTDGVSGEVSDSRIGEIFQSTPDEENPAQRLVDEAVACGGRDNATAITISVASAATAPRHTGAPVFTTVDRATLPIPPEHLGNDDEQDSEQNSGSLSEE